MNHVERTLEVDPPSQAALDDLQGMIRRRYPAARFAVAWGDDPEGFSLKATVDLADVDEVVDQELLDRLFEIQVEHGLPVYVIALQPVDRVLVEVQKRKRGRPRLGQDPSTAVSLRLDRASVARLREVAEARGIGPTPWPSSRSFRGRSASSRHPCGCSRCAD